MELHRFKIRYRWIMMRILILWILPIEFNSLQSRVGVSSQFKYNKGSLNLNAAYSEYDRAFVSTYPSLYKSKNLYLIFIINMYLTIHFIRLLD